MIKCSFYVELGWIRAVNLHCVTKGIIVWCTFVIIIAKKRLVSRKHKFSGTNQKPQLRRPFGTCLVRHCPQGLFLLFFTFLRATFFCPFRLSLAPLICPWVSEDACSSTAKTIHHSHTNHTSLMQAISIVGLKKVCNFPTHPNSIFL